MTYKLAPVCYGQTKSACVIRLEDMAAIPFDPANTDYQSYLAWLEEGNEPLPADEPELTWDDIRSERDRLIAESDWTMTPGATVNQHDWAVYRQILRDIPQTFKGQEPSAVIWPEKPSADGPNVRAVEVALRAAEDAAAAAVKVTSTAKINEEQTES